MPKGVYKRKRYVRPRVRPHSPKLVPDSPLRPAAPDGEHVWYWLPLANRAIQPHRSRVTLVSFRKRRPEAPLPKGAYTIWIVHFVDAAGHHWERYECYGLSGELL